MTEIIPMPIDDAVVEEVKENRPSVNEVIEPKFKQQIVTWNNFNTNPPDTDRWFYMYCPMGKIAPNFYLCYRDAAGNYELPHPTKKYPVQAWAYAVAPEVEE